MTGTRLRSTLRWFHLLFGLLGIYMAGSCYTLARATDPALPAVLKSTF